MAPYKEDRLLSKNMIALSGYLAEKFPSSPSLKKIARSTEFKGFLFCLSEVAPSVMKGPLKRASRKCEHALRVEEKARVARKRVAPPNNNGKNAKRVKISHPSEREAESDVVTQVLNDTRLQPLQNCGVKENEESNPQTNLQCPQKSLPDTPIPDEEETSRTEDTAKEDFNATPLRNEQSRTGSPLHGQQADAVTILPTRYQVEIGLVRKTPAIEAYIRAALRNLKPTYRPCFNVDGEMTEILMVASFLEFFRTKRELQHHLESREKMPSEKLQARVTWDTSDPSKILDALEDIMRNTIDNKIHRAYGQTVLFSSVNAQVAKGYRSTATGHRSDHTAILEELAHKRAGSVSKREVEQMVSKYLNEYYAGQKWSAVIDWFGCGGIVLIFVIAEIGSYYVERKWTDYQRDCLHYLAGYLGSIKGLVEVLGSDALGIYCRNGCLGWDCIDRVKLVQFTDSDDEREDEDEDEVGFEMKIGEEEEQGIQNDDGTEIEDGDGEDDTDTDGDEDENALPDDDLVVEDEAEDEDEDEDEHEDEDGDGDDSN